MILYRATVVRKSFWKSFLTSTVSAPKLRRKAAAYVTRVSVHDLASLNKAKKAIKKAFQMQMEGKGFTFVEVLACCPTNWGKTPAASIEWLKENMIPYFPLGVYKDVDGEVK